jgi:hypothetical protein
VLERGRPSRWRCPVSLLSEALAEQVRHLDEERAAVAAKARFDLAGERIKTVPVHVVVISQVKRGTGIRRPAKKKLALDVGSD